MVDQLRLRKENVFWPRHLQCKMYHLRCFIRKFEKCINAKPPRDTTSKHKYTVISVFHWNCEIENKSNKVNEKYCICSQVPFFSFLWLLPDLFCIETVFTHKIHQETESSYKLFIQYFLIKNGLKRIHFLNSNENNICISFVRFQWWCHHPPSLFITVSEHRLCTQNGKFKFQPT